MHGSTGGATGAGFGLLYFDWRIGGPRGLWPSAPGAEAHAGIAFYAPDLRLQQTVEGKKPLTRRTLALLQ